MTLAQRLAGVPDLEVRTDEPLCGHTSFGIGGPADVLALPGSVSAVQHVVAAALELGQPLTIIGSGTNLLVRDGGVRGIVLKIADNLARTCVEGTSVRAQAGARMSTVAQAAAAASLSGLEFAAGIPGTVGGAVLMNAGAYGGEMGEVVDWVEVVDAEAQVRRLAREELGFGYRHSALMDTRSIVVGAQMTLAPGRPEAIAARTTELLQRRQSKQPLDLPSAGSVFKRPEGRYAGQLIEQARCKGMRVGQAEVSRKHAGFIVNLGGASAADVEELIRRVQEAVARDSGVRLELEIRVIGEPA
ncbi:MAG: UDP-N-acetylmuramate dehydrogenase [Armatimonadota bacterium]